jgi:hypothetical protein
MSVGAVGVTDLILDIAARRGGGGYPHCSQLVHHQAR